ncbi:hypothetical protein [Streptomyces sp. NBC_00872]|uniref:hypothetical protein n=1 Tax=Streptomyces sp. NBC_00872 TaxID=2903686 RepID=UPI003868E8B7|nr:hypothetical protein OG214_05605 [Streptomyces sp. NBC_00872]
MPISASADVQQILVRYVRDTDHRDGTSLSERFTPRGRVDISAKNAKGVSAVRNLNRLEPAGESVPAARESLARRGPRPAGRTDRCR